MNFTFWPNSDPDTISQSKKDQDNRIFEIQFEIQNMANGVIRDSALSLSKNEVRTQTDSEGRRMEMYFQKNEFNRLQRIVCRFENNQFQSTINFAYNSISHLLSFLSVMHGIAIGFYGIVVYDKKHNASWISKPQSPAPDLFSLPKGLGLDDKFRTILSLYREGKANTSVYYSFLCFYKILEAFHERREAFKGLDKLIKENPKKLKPIEIKITQSDLVYCLVPGSEQGHFIGKSSGSLYKFLSVEYRPLVAHSIPKLLDPLNFDQYENLQRYSWLSNIAEKIGRDLILQSLNLYADAYDKGILK